MQSLGRTGSYLQISSRAMLPRRMHLQCPSEYPIIRVSRARGGGEPRHEFLKCWESSEIARIVGSSGSFGSSTLYNVVSCSDSSNEPFESGHERGYTRILNFIPSGKRRRSLWLSSTAIPLRSDSVTTDDSFVVIIIEKEKRTHKGSWYKEDARVTRGHKYMVTEKSEREIAN